MPYVIECDETEYIIWLPADVYVNEHFLDLALLASTPLAFDRMQNDVRDMSMAVSNIVMTQMDVCAALDPFQSDQVNGHTG